ncbi:MAG TPA: hypothetical protein VJY54_14080 [Lachnospiraceae bacterium]|nr:hypothetical protein [Lachnospiraceae bacterium]
MKLKYYLRGLGIGILVTAVIMGISAGRQNQMSDEEVKVRARELGMVESTTLSNMASVLEKETVSENAEPQNTEKDNTESDNTENDNKENDNTETIEDSGSGNTQTENKQAEESTPIVSDEGELVTITIQSGESSVSVSKSLAEAGLVESASSYDKYLCSNEYDKKIVTGTYHIPMGATYEDIAKVITGKLSFD